MSDYVLAVDIGGTFTDMVLVGDDGLREHRKVSSTPPHFEEAILDGLDTILSSTSINPGDIGRLPHGTTVATNAILERRGVRTALVTTKGFRDVLELARLRRPSLFDTEFEKPPPLAPRELRFELDERVLADGAVVREPSETEIEELAGTLATCEVESLAVCFINSYRNPVNEARVVRLLSEALPELQITASHEILPEIKEYERSSTAVVNAYIRPPVGRYLERLGGSLFERGMEINLQVMQSSGSLLDAETSRAQPVRLIESGPAAGVIAAQALGADLGVPNVIAFDMGGTTAKASLIENGRLFEAQEQEVGGTMNHSRLFTQGAGYTVRVPSIDIAEVGAGGGSIFWVDQGGAPRVGPKSAGAVPGPVCYRSGGTDVTVTDANLVLGYLNPGSLAGGTQPIDLAAAQQAVDAQVADRLGTSRLKAAYGVHTLANTNMGQAIRGVSIERGRDPRNFVLVAYGGAGPVHAALIAKQFEVERVVVPVNPGLFSAVGLQVSDMRYDYVASYPSPDEPNAEMVTARFAELEEKATRALVLNRGQKGLVFKRFLDQRYRGQTYELSIEIGNGGPLNRRDLEQAARDFHIAHERTYGHSGPDEPVQVINLRLQVTVPTAKVHNIFQMHGQQHSSGETTRKAYFGRTDGLVETPVVSRAGVPVEEVEGPMIVEDMDSTTVVPPSHYVRRDEAGNIFIRLGEDS